ncbi:MAG: bifunctional 2-polyprenyl-6-hydroxyphenol methylase/3-demethylubiquinol 3-O-methyltransferase UbiG [Alphaproteobacteria bacterium]|nr:bifunctional 2-polyprenyl-6-hydroxyphenol methylase/3-demethylubiquinol 3-O-methyltransferase UbiG [Alphaproteobacteria bacterium]
MSSAHSSSIDPAEVEKFSAMAEAWWDPTGAFAPLHRFNPVRLSFIRNEALARFGRDPRSLTPFTGLTLLDLGCGGGLLCEPMTRLGFAVTGVDASEKNIHVAHLHAQQQALPITYRTATAEMLAGEGRSFDVVLNMEVIEHVADPLTFLKSCAELVRPGGILISATLNKTFKSLALAKFAAEYVLRWLPPGTHDWNRFLPPAQLHALLKQSGLEVTKLQGVSFSPLSWDWHLSHDTDVNYMMVAHRPTS